MSSLLGQALREAKRILPLPRLLQRMGFGEATLDRNAECPFCKSRKGKFALLKDQSDRWSFKCHKQGCVANENEYGHNEIAFLQLHKGCSEMDAFRDFIRMAEEISGAPLYDFDRDNRGEAAPPAEPEPFAPRNPFDALHHRMILNARDTEILARKRGLTKETAHKLGFRTNNRGNGDYIRELTESYPEERLIQLGILRNWRNRNSPNEQLLGKGITGQKDEDGDPIFDWNEPIIIPYLDRDGHAFYLRPHKGGLKQERDEFDESALSSHVYCPFLLSSIVNFDGTVIITEGEFKAAAAWQAGVACVAVPGISFGKNEAFRKELVNLIRDYKATRIVIIFDNEVKDDPRFKDRFKADPHDRYDTEMWAVYLARDLRDEFESVTVGILPDEWRIDGKGDIDGALAGFVHGVPGHAVFERGLGFEEGGRMLRRGLRAACDASLRHDHFLKSLPASKRNIVRNKLEKKWNPPVLRFGGDAEEKLVRRFMQLDSMGNPIDPELSGAFRRIHGSYYLRRRFDKKTNELLEIQIKSLERQIAMYGEMPKEEREVDGEEDEIPGLTAEDRMAFGPSLGELKTRLAAAWERLRGMPDGISDFILRCDYKRHGADGNVIRLVRIKNKRAGKWSERMYELSAAQSCTATKFREWGLATGLAVWSSGQEALDALMQDLDNAVEGRNIFEITSYGFHKKSEIWFYGDCAFPPEGQVIPADDSNIIWYNGDGYQVESSIEDRGTAFEQKAPMMLAAQETAAQPGLTALDAFHGMTGDFLSVFGDYDAWLFIGSMAGYAIAPELLAKFGGHPGAWVYGVRGGGKTTIVRWGMRMWGYGHLDGIGIDDRTTPVGMNRTLAQYSCLPVWFEEYRHATITPQKEAVLRGAFDRNSGAKGQADGTNRTRSAKIFTTPVVSGESSSSDSATRSRYTQFNIAKSRRRPDAEQRYSGVQESCKHYYLIGRYLMENRAEFWRLCEPMIREWWEESEKVKERVADERVRYVYSVARACFTVLAQMLGSRLDDLEEFDAAALRFAEVALQDVVDETFINQFWSDILSGLRSGEIDKNLFDRQLVVMDPATGALRQSNADGCFNVVFIAAKAVYDQYAVYIRKQGRTPKNELADMRRDIAREKYWIEPPKNSSRAHKVRMNKSTPSCWAIVCDENDERSFHDWQELTELVEKPIPGVKDPE